MMPECMNGMTVHDCPPLHEPFWVGPILSWWRDHVGHQLFILCLGMPLSSPGWDETVCHYLCTLCWAQYTLYFYSAPTQWCGPLFGSLQCPRSLHHTFLYLKGGLQPSSPLGNIAPCSWYVPRSDGLCSLALVGGRAPSLVMTFNLMSASLVLSRSRLVFWAWYPILEVMNDISHQRVLLAPPGRSLADLYLQYQFPFADVWTLSK